jgi:hypothetical protein
MQLPPIYKISDTVTITSEHLSNPASIPVRDKRLNLVYKISTLAVLSTQSPTPYLLGGISPGVGQLLHEVYHSPPPSAELKNKWSFPSTQPYATTVSTGEKNPFICKSYLRFSVSHNRCAAQKSLSGRSCDRSNRHKFFLVSLFLKANGKMVPKAPRCHYMLLTWPSRSKLSSNCIHVN